jgi:hypothetical protein
MADRAAQPHPGPYWDAEKQQIMRDLDRPHDDAPDTYSVFNVDGKRILKGADRASGFALAKDTAGAIVAREVPRAPKEPFKLGSGPYIVSP